MTIASLAADRDIRPAGARSAALRSLAGSSRSVSLADSRVATVRSADWPRYVEFVIGDAATVVRDRAPFDLIFADAPSGKIEGLHHTITALRAGGVLVVDDMDPRLHQDDGLLGSLADVRDQILRGPSLISAELDFATGVLVATKRSCR